MPDGQLRLSWNLAIRLLTSSDFPSLRIDALTGEILEVVNWTHACSFHESAYRRLDHQHCQHDYKEEITDKSNNKNNLDKQPVKFFINNELNIINFAQYFYWFGGIVISLEILLN